MDLFYKIQPSAFLNSADLDASFMTTLRAYGAPKEKADLADGGVWLCGRERTMLTASWTSGDG